MNCWKRLLTCALVISAATSAAAPAGAQEPVEVLRVGPVRAITAPGRVRLWTVIRPTTGNQLTLEAVHLGETAIDPASVRLAPVSTGVVLVVDGSAATARLGFTGLANTIVHALVGQLRPHLDRPALVSFGRESRLVHAFSDFPSRLSRRDLELPGEGPSCTWEGLTTGLEQAATSPFPAQVVVLVTTGAPEGEELCRNRSAADVARLARAIGSPVHIIHLTPDPAATPGQLAQMARQTGGSYWAVSSTSEVASLAQAVTARVAAARQLTLEAPFVPGTHTLSLTGRTEAGRVAGSAVVALTAPPAGRGLAVVAATASPAAAAPGQTVTTQPAAQNSLSGAPQGQPVTAPWLVGLLLAAAGAGLVYARRRWPPAFLPALTAWRPLPRLGQLHLPLGQLHLPSSLRSVALRLPSLPVLRPTIRLTHLAGVLQWRRRARAGPGEVRQAVLRRLQAWQLVLEGQQERLRERCRAWQADLGRKKVTLSEQLASLRARLRPAVGIHPPRRHVLPEAKVEAPSPATRAPEMAEPTPSPAPPARLAEPETAPLGPAEWAPPVRRRSAPLGPAPFALVGTTSGKYRLEAPLGRGGLGEVYRGRDLVLDRPVAVKILTGPAYEGNAAVDQLRREAALAAQLNHPHVITIHEITSFERRAAIVMEYVEGQSLAALAAEAPLTDEQLAPILEGIAAALDAAHSQGVIHGDVKPSNVLVGSNGQVKLCDFGIARRTGDDRNAPRAGTPGYIPPEVEAGEEPDERSDIYSLGALAVAMLTGRPDGIDHLPPHLASVLSSALEADPNARCNRAGILASSFRTAVEKERLRRRGPLGRLKDAVRMRLQRRQQPQATIRQEAFLPWRDAMPAYLPPDPDLTRPLNEDAAHAGEDDAASPDTAPLDSEPQTEAMEAPA